MQRSRRNWFPILLLTVMLAACSSNTSAPTASRGAATTAVSTTVPVSPTAANVTALVASAAPAPSAAATSTGSFTGIEQGTTPEGYHALGSATAPATLVMYSDFL